jgi:hypothetical protein
MLALPLVEYQMTYAVIFGKPETGSPIPAEQINAVAYLISLSQVECKGLTMMSNFG